MFRLEYERSFSSLLAQVLRKHGRNKYHLRLDITFAVDWNPFLPWDQYEA